jgi:glutathione S-transferase
MEPVFFYGAPQGCSFGSIMALEWLGQPYRLCRIDMMERPWHPAYRQVNPRMLTPALMLEDGKSISESMAILQNIAARDLDKRLGFRQGTREFDRLNEMLAYLNTDFFSAFTPLWTLYETEGLTGQQQELLRRLGNENVAKELAYLDGVLERRDWLLGGTERTVADAYLTGVARWALYHKLFNIDEAYPNLARHLGKLHSDPGVRFAMAIEKGEQPVGSGAFKGHVTLDALAPRLAA